MSPERREYWLEQHETEKNRERNQRLKELAAELCEYATAYRNRLTRVFEEDYK